ncbi:hypothetical protein AB0I60_12965 [Actinosynnema sp. NPDC050436]|uniref:hypothetical protein n=1 Tax=Actinosynnema sp. NPDC050436 TaxID=3155659 RepID=UPI0033F7821B
MVDSADEDQWITDLAVGTDLALWRVDTDLFDRYVATLAETGAPATFLDISSAHYETGYSDPGLFSDLKHAVEFFLLTSHVLRRELLESRNRDQEATLERLARTAFTAGAFDNAKEWANRQVGGLADFFGLAVAGENLAQKQRAMEDVALTFYCQEVADRLSVPYAPHPLRAPFAVLWAIGPDDRVAPDEGSLSASLEYLRACRARKANEVPAHGDPVSGLHVDVRTRPPRSLRFVQDLAQVSDATPRLAPLVSRVFGPERARAWNAGRATFDAITGIGRSSTLLTPVREARP